VVYSATMEIVPKDPALTQFVTEEQFGEMGETFKELAESGKSLTRLPRREFSRRKVLEAIDEAFQLIGGVPRLAHWAHHNPTEFYKLFGKTIPAASQMEVMGQLTHTILPALPRSPLDSGGEIYDAENSVSRLQRTG
jgi:hypothetical protein